jgi:hypothetical protein
MRLYQITVRPAQPNGIAAVGLQPATIFLLMYPAYTMVTILSVSASVILRPSTNCCCMPNWSASFVANFPPPCTSIFFPSMAANDCRNEESLFHHQ